jgi:hypothetical protein
LALGRTAFSITTFSTMDIIATLSITTNN